VAGVEFKQLAEGFFYASGLFKDVGSETSTRQAKQAAQRTKRFFMKTIPLPLKTFKTRSMRAWDVVGSFAHDAHFLVLCETIPGSSSRFRSPLDNFNHAQCCATIFIRHGARLSTREACLMIAVPSPRGIWWAQPPTHHTKLQAPPAQT